MKRLHIASIGLAAFMALAAVSFATATYGHAPSAYPAAHSASVCSLNNNEHQKSQPTPSNGTRAKASLPAARLTAQVPIATVCQTLAGPACPMVVALPVGSPCTCYFPYGALAGVTR
jgi:hypothetical protein